MRLVLVLLFAACSSKQTNGGGGGGTNEVPVTPGCEGARKKIEQLYRAEADANKEKPERVEESVADNTTMVMNDCAKAPDKVTACVKRVSTAAELEKQCLVPLDNEGTEGEALRK
jgi:hypothetical protein